MDLTILAIGLLLGIGIPLRNRAIKNIVRIRKY